VVAPTEADAMQRAVALASRGRGRTSPNPVVGCVVLDAAGAVAGEGFHERAGWPHAEVRALTQAGPRARGGTAVVTLEPCRHTGRTGPCTAALVAAGVRRVVVGVRDPYPPAAGGVDVLRSSGIEVEVGVGAPEAARVNEAWLTFARHRRPHLTWKYAASLDGRVAAADGTSRWITGPAARADGHRLRAESDAVMVGSGTVLADDPQLAVRDADLLGGQPLRVVVDTEARTPATARLFDSAAPTLVAVAQDAPLERIRMVESLAAVARLPRGPGGLDVAALLAELAARDVVSVLLEGGPTLAGTFLEGGFVDRVVGYTAPLLIGGGGLPVLGGAGAAGIDAAWRLQLDEVDRIGPDLRLVARPRRKES
jgi:diaminohydroxyphosphoribosylaminopyrimidine deaminase/5-amino-6-(5-phosphoribosylamino)uracil reductase